MKYYSNKLFFFKEKEMLVLFSFVTNFSTKKIKMFRFFQNENLLLGYSQNVHAFIDLSSKNVLLRLKNILLSVS